MDSQMVELLGRNKLISELLRADIEVALPLRDRGVDLVAYAELSAKVKSFAAVPLQMKAASSRSFSVQRKFERISNLLLVHIWHVDSPDEAILYALRYPQAVDIAEQMGWTKSDSWKRGSYSTTRPIQASSVLS